MANIKVLTIQKPGALFLCAFVFVGCAWVKPMAESEQVALVKLSATQSCVKLGVTASKTLSTVLFVPRGQAKQLSELVTLAKNEAVIMKGDTIAAESTVTNGEQRFGIYRCQ